MIINDIKNDVKVLEQKIQNLIGDFITKNGDCLVHIDVEHRTVNNGPVINTVKVEVTI